jgi:hypothetical protein
MKITRKLIASGTLLSVLAVSAAAYGQSSNLSSRLAPGNQIAFGGGQFKITPTTTIGEIDDWRGMRNLVPLGTEWSNLEHKVINRNWTVKKYNTWVKKNPKSGFTPFRYTPTGASMTTGKSGPTGVDPAWVQGLDRQMASGNNWQAAHPDGPVAIQKAAEGKAARRMAGARVRRRSVTDASTPIVNGLLKPLLHLTPSQKRTAWLDSQSIKGNAWRAAHPDGSAAIMGTYKRTGQQLQAQPWADLTMMGSNRLHPQSGRDVQPYTSGFARTSRSREVCDPRNLYCSPGP